METDEIIEEVYRIRLELAAQNNFDIRRLVSQIQAAERQEKGAVFIPPAEHPATTGVSTTIAT